LTRTEDFDEDDHTSPENEAITFEVSGLTSASVAEKIRGGEVEINDRVQRIIAAERHHQQGVGLLDKGRFKEAAKCLARAVSACEEEGEFRASLAWAIFQAGLDDDSAKQALEHLDEAIIKSPSARAYMFRGHVLRFLERSEDALWCFQEALRKDPSNEEAQSEIERIHENRNESG
jgi:tetratricopeptide (TPR) repeat protein